MPDTPSGADLRNQSLENERQKARNAIPKGKSHSDIDLRSFMNALSDLGRFDEAKVTDSLSRFSNFVFKFRDITNKFDFDPKGASAFVSSIDFISSSVSRINAIPVSSNFDAILSAVTGFSTISQSIAKINFDGLSRMSEKQVELATTSFPTIFSNILDTYKSFDVKIEEVNKTFTDLKSVQLGPTVQEFFAEFAQSLNIDVDKEGNIISKGEVIGSTGAFKAFQQISQNIVGAIENVGKLSIISVLKAKASMAVAGKLNLGISFNEFMESMVNSIIGKESIMMKVYETKTDDEFTKAMSDPRGRDRGRSYDAKPQKMNAIEAAFVISNNVATLINTFGDGMYRKILKAKTSLMLAEKMKFGDSINRLISQIVKASDVIGTREQQDKVDSTLRIIESFLGIFTGRDAPLSLFNVTKMISVGIILTPAAIAIGAGLTVLVGTMNFVSLIMGKGRGNKNEMIQSLSEFSKAVLILSGALGLFALSALATSIIFSNINYGSLFAGLAIFTYIVALTAIVMLLDKSFGRGREGGFQSFATSVLILSGALIIFSLGIWTMGKVIENSNIVAILAGLAIFSLFVFVTNRMGTDSKIYAKGILLIMGLSIAVALFSGAIWLMGKAISSWGSLGSVVIGTVIMFLLIRTAEKLGEKWEQNLAGAAVIFVLAGSYLLMAHAITVMGKAINSFGGFVSVALGTAIFGAVIWLAQKLGDKKNFEDSIKGAAAMAIVAGALLIFSLAVKVMADAMKSWDDFGRVALMSTIFVIISGAAVIFGKGSKDIILGAAAMAIIAGSLFIFSLAVKVMADAMKDWDDFGRVALMSVIFVGISAAAIAFGSAFPVIIAGAAAMAIVAGALLIFSVAVKVLAEIEYPDEFMQARMKGFFMSLGNSVAYMGQMMVWITLGSIAMGIMALPLIAFTLAIKSASLIDWKDINKRMFEGDGKSDGPFTSVVKGTLNAFKEIGFFGSVKAMAGAAAIAVISASMLAFAGAMAIVNKLEWHDIYKNLIGTPEDRKQFGIDVSADKDLTILGQIIGSIVKSFIFDGTYGLKLDTWKLLEGSRAVNSVAVTLLGIGQSVQRFGNLASSMNLNGKHKKINGASGPELEFEDNSSIQAMIYNTVMAVGSVFGFIGTQWPSGWLGLVKSPVAQGIESVKGVGKVLNDIAKGVKEWQDISGMGLSENDFNFKMDPSTGEVTGTGIAANIGKTVMAISKVFGHIGANLQTVPPSGLFGAIKGLIFGPETTIGKGMEAVSGVGEVLKGISEGVKVFANLGELGLSDADFILNMNDQGIVDQGASGVMNNMARVIMAVSSVFAQIGGNSKVYYSKEVDAGGIKGFFGGKSEQKVYFSDAVEMGVKAMQGAGAEVAAMANAIKILSEMGDPKNIDVSTRRITALVTSVGNIYAKIGSGQAGFDLKAMDQGIKAMKGAGNEVKAFADSIAVFKTDKDQSIQSWETIKTTLGGMMMFTADKLNYFGGGKTEDGKLPLDPNILSKGQRTLKEMTKSTEEIKKLSDALRGMTGENQQPISTKSLDSNLNSITDIFNKSSFATLRPETVVNFRNNVSLIMNEFRNLGKLWEYSGELSIMNPGISSLNSHLSTTYDLIRSPIITNMRMKDFRNLVNEIEKLGKVADPFEKFEKSFKGFNETVKKMVENVNNIQVDKFTAFTDFNKTLIQLSKQPKSQFEAVKEYVDHVINAWFEQMAQYNANTQSQIQQGFAQTNTHIQATNENISGVARTQGISQGRNDSGDATERLIALMSNGGAKVEVTNLPPSIQ